MMSVIVTLLAVLSSVMVAADKQFVIDTSAGATFISGIGANGAYNGIAATGVNGVGSVVEVFDGSYWEGHKVQSGMLLDAAVTAYGAAVVTGVYTTLTSVDTLTYTSAEVKGTSQSANVFGTNRDKMALVGTWTIESDNKFPTAIASVATSSDNGQSFSLSAPVNSDGYVRYGAFPSETTWYVSAGMWGNDPAKTIEGVHELSARVVMDGYKNRNRYNLREPAPRVRSADNSTTGWWGTVSKTTDGGKSWAQVLTTNIAEDYLYFNAISCSSETNCVVVAEGDDVNGGYLTVAYATFDGGVTWEKTFNSKDLVSLMGFKFVSANEGWMLGTAKSGRNLLGQFYKTLDGGKTFSLVQSLNNCFGLDLDFVNEGGYAACCNSAGTSCFPAIYK